MGQGLTTPLWGAALLLLACVGGACIDTNSVEVPCAQSDRPQIWVIEDPQNRSEDGVEVPLIRAVEGCEDFPYSLTSDARLTVLTPTSTLDRLLITAGWQDTDTPNAGAARRLPIAPFLLVTRDPETRTWRASETMDASLLPSSLRDRRLLPAITSTQEVKCLEVGNCLVPHASGEDYTTCEPCAPCDGVDDCGPKAVRPQISCPRRGDGSESRFDWEPYRVADDVDIVWPGENTRTASISICLPPKTNREAVHFPLADCVLRNGGYWPKEPTSGEVEANDVAHVNNLLNPSEPTPPPSVILLKATEAGSSLPEVLISSRLTPALSDTIKIRGCGHVDETGTLRASRLGRIRVEGRDVVLESVLVEPPDGANNTSAAIELEDAKIELVQARVELPGTVTAPSSVAAIHCQSDTTSSRCEIQGRGVVITGCPKEGNSPRACIDIADNSTGSALTASVSVDLTDAIIAGRGAAIRVTHQTRDAPGVAPTDLRGVSLKLTRVAVIAPSPDGPLTSLEPTVSGSGEATSAYSPSPSKAIEVRGTGSLDADRLWVAGFQHAVESERCLVPRIRDKCPDRQDVALTAVDISGSIFVGGPSTVDSSLKPLLKAEGHLKVTDEPKVTGHPKVTGLELHSLGGAGIEFLDSGGGVELTDLTVWSAGQFGVDAKAGIVSLKNSRVYQARGAAVRTQAAPDTKIDRVRLRATATKQADWNGFCWAGQALCEGDIQGFKRIPPPMLVENSELWAPRGIQLRWGGLQFTNGTIIVDTSPAPTDSTDPTAPAPPTPAVFQLREATRDECNGSGSIIRSPDDARCHYWPLDSIQNVRVQSVRVKTRTSTAPDEELFEGTNGGRVWIGP